MAHRLTLTGIALITVLQLIAIPTFALADDTPPREGDIWGWRDHEPVPSEVHRDEQAAGVATSPEQQKRTNDEVESIYRQLLGGEGQQQK